LTTGQRPISTRGRSTTRSSPGSPTAYRPAGSVTTASSAGTSRITTSRVVRLPSIAERDHLTLEGALLYLDQNYLSGFAKRKPAFRELEPVLRAAIDAGAVAVVESPVHERESRRRPDLGLLALLRDLSGGRRLPAALDGAALEVRRRMLWTIEQELPERHARASDEADLDAMAAAIVHCDLVTCDAFMADVLRRSRMDLRHGCELFSGRRRDVLRLRDQLQRATPSPPTGS
jgi:hypothetical protein